MLTKKISDIMCLTSSLKRLVWKPLGGHIYYGCLGFISKLVDKITILFY